MMLRRPNRSYRVTALAVILLAAATCRLAAQEHKGAEPAPPAAGHQAAEPAHDAGHGASGESSNPLEVQPGLAIWTLLVFVGLLLLLGRFAWKPLLKALHQREHHLQHVLEETERARNESETLLTEHRRQMARAADEVRALIDRARQDAQATADQLVKQAHDESEAARQRAQRDIASARDQALAEIWQKTADTAVAVAGRVLSTELKPEDHRRLLDAAIRELPAAGGSNGQGGRHA
jgi:F-type H+-transporting ATPase subunit b